MGSQSICLVAWAVRKSAKDNLVALSYSAIQMDFPDKRGSDCGMSIVFGMIIETEAFSYTACGYGDDGGNSMVIINWSQLDYVRFR